MSELPTIHEVEVSRRLGARLLEALEQLSRVELLAEALRNERDQARNELDRLSAYIDSLNITPPEN